MRSYCGHRPQTSQSESICKSVGYFRHSLLVLEITGKEDQYKRTYYACRLTLNGLRLTEIRLANQFILQLIVLGTKWLNACEYHFLNDSSDWNCLDSLFITKAPHLLPNQYKWALVQAIETYFVTKQFPEQMLYVIRYLVVTWSQYVKWHIYRALSYQNIVHDNIHIYAVILLFHWRYQFIIVCTKSHWQMDSPESEPAVRKGY